jgi:hypothetical protein
MKSTMTAFALAGAALVAASWPQAAAAGCAAGPHRAGCVGPRGGAVATGPRGAAAAGPHGAAATTRAPAYRGYTYHGGTAHACASGPYRAGCTGPHGTAVVRRPY